MWQRTGRGNVWFLPRMFDKRRKIQATICLVYIAALAIADLSSASLNFAIFYTLVLICFRWMGLKKDAWGPVAVGLIALTYLGYFGGRWPEDAQGSWSNMLHSFRMVNRTFAAAAIAVISLCTPLFGDTESKSQPSGGREGAATGLACVIMSIGILLADLLSPATFNLAILYAVPILLAPASRSRRPIFLLLPMVVVVVWLELYLDPAGWHVPVTPTVVHARLLATVALVGAIVMHFRLFEPTTAPVRNGRGSHSGWLDSDDRASSLTRPAAPRPHREPTFIGIGAPKAGTTWIFKCLQAHPQIFLAQVKETMFFHKFFYSEDRMDEYWEHFEDAGDAIAVGEFSTNYLASEQAVDRVKKHLPEAKILIALRNPIDQMYSHYWHLLRQNFHHGDQERRSFEEAMAMYQEHLIEPSLYCKHVSRWLEHFDRRQVHFILFEDIRDRPQQVVRELYAFLGVDPNFTPDSLDEKSSATRAGTSPRNAFLGRLHARVYQLLVNYGYRHVRGFFGNRRADAIKESLGIRSWMERIFHRPGYPPMKPATRGKLREMLKPEIQGMERILGRELSSWK